MGDRAMMEELRALAPWLVASVFGGLVTFFFWSIRAGQSRATAAIEKLVERMDKLESAHHSVQANLPKTYADKHENDDTHKALFQRLNTVDRTVATIQGGLAGRNP